MKNEIRILGLDDAPFNFQDSHTTVIGVVMRGGKYLEGVLSKKIKIDGNDATSTCIEMIKNTRHKLQIKAVLFDGGALGGFNILDIEQINKIANIPVITVTREQPDFEKIKKALIKHFKDGSERFDLLKKGDLHQIETDHNPIFIKCAGICAGEAKEIIKICTIRGVIPEPIRLAHIIASGITRGESYGKA